MEQRTVDGQRKVASQSTESTEAVRSHIRQMSPMLAAGQLREVSWVVFFPTAEMATSAVKKQTIKCFSHFLLSAPMKIPTQSGSVACCIFYEKNNEKNYSSKKNPLLPTEH